MYSAKTDTKSPQNSNTATATAGPKGFWARSLDLYVDGFRRMGRLGRWLWVLIIVKCIILFAVLKLFFFPDLLQRDYDNDTERAAAVRSALTQPKSGDSTTDIQPIK